MPRYIDADAFRQRMYHEAFETDTELQKWDSGCWIRYKLFENCIEEMPTLSPDDVRVVGEWKYDHWYEFKCSICGEWSKTNPRGKEKFCPSCGAKMEVSDERNERI